MIPFQISPVQAATLTRQRLLSRARLHRHIEDQRRQKELMLHWMKSTPQGIVVIDDLCGRSVEPQSPSRSPN